MKYFFRLLKEFFFRFRALLLVGIGIGLIAFTALRFLSPLLFLSSTHRIGITGRFTTESIPVEILAEIGDGLTKINNEGTPEPSLATSWESQEDGKVWIFHLDSKKTWQDGTKITSDTIKYNFIDVEVARPDEKTIIFRLKNPFSPFPNIVSRPAFKKGLLGTGNWKVTNLSLVAGLVERLEIVNKDGQKKIYKFYPTEERTKDAFKLGEVDVIRDLITLGEFGNWKTAGVSAISDKKKFVAIFFNTKDNSLSDKSLRQSLFYAIKKDDLPGERAFSPISPNSWVYNPQVKAYEYDLERARELAKEGIEIKLLTPSVLLPVAEKIVKDWQLAGIKAISQVTPTVPDEYQAYLAIYDIPNDPDQYPLWHSSQIESRTNISKFSNPRIDKLLEDGRIEEDDEERKKIYLDFQRFLLEDAPAAFLYHPITYTITRK